MVGYSTSTTVSEYGFTAIASTFTDVGSENEISLSSITGEFERGDSIQAFDAGGNVTFTVTYKARGGVWGWYDDDNNLITDKKFTRGGSIWLSTASSINVTINGQVNRSETIVNLYGDYQFTQTGNSTPMPVKLSDITFSSVERGDSIQVFDAGGNVNFTLTYKQRGGVWGWYDDDNTLQANYTFEPGAAFWVSCSSAGTMKLPALQIQ